jgi:hypothetical protein
VSSLILSFALTVTVTLALILALIVTLTWMTTIPLWRARPPFNFKFGLIRVMSYGLEVRVRVKDARREHQQKYLV